MFLLTPQRKSLNFSSSIRCWSCNGPAMDQFNRGKNKHGSAGSCIHSSFGSRSRVLVFNQYYLGSTAFFCRPNTNTLYLIQCHGAVLPPTSSSATKLFCGRGLKWMSCCFISRILISTVSNTSLIDRRFGGGSSDRSNPPASCRSGCTYGDSPGSVH